jgi:hypothetical protein
MDDETPRSRPTYPKPIWSAPPVSSRSTAGAPSKLIPSLAAIGPKGFGERGMADCLYIGYRPHWLPHLWGKLVALYKTAPA